MSNELITLEDVGINLTPMGAEVPTDLTIEGAGIAIHLLTRIGNSARWALADVSAMSMGKFGEQYIQLIEATQMSQGSLQNLMYVWRKFPTIESREWDLSLSHYTAVCADYLTPDDRAAILQYAYDEGLSRDQTRDIVKGYGPVVVMPTFSKEAFITRLDHLISWAESNGAPDELLSAIKELFSDFKKEDEWDFPD